MPQMIFPPLRAVVHMTVLFFYYWCSMEFLSKSSAGDGPLVAFGGSDGVIRVLSMISWKVFPAPQYYTLLLIYQVSFKKHKKKRRSICLYCAVILSFLQLVRRYTGGHKGSISCLMNFMASSGEVAFWSSENLDLWGLYDIFLLMPSPQTFY